MARHRARTAVDSFIPGDAMLTLSFTYNKDGVVLHLTDLNSETVLASTDTLNVRDDNHDEVIVNGYIALLEDAREAMYGQ